MENDTSLDYPPSPSPEWKPFIFIISSLMASLSPVLCSSVRVSGADSDCADCAGDYSLLTSRVSWAEGKPLYKHVDSERYLFSFLGLGWAIGSSRVYLAPLVLSRGEEPLCGSA